MSEQETDVAAMAELTNALAERERRIEALMLTLERKSEEHETMRASYAAMHDQVNQMRMAAYAKLGLPPPVVEATPTPDTATTDDENHPPEQQPSAPAAEATPTQQEQGAEPQKQPPQQPSLPKPLADALREPLQHGKFALQKLDEAASKRIDEAKEVLERGRDGLARGLSEALARMRPEVAQTRPT